MEDFSLLASVSKERIKNIESKNDRSINLFRREIKRSLQMSGVRDYSSFGLHRKVISQEFCSICQLLGSKLKPVATLLINQQNDSPKFFSLNNLLVEVCPLLQIENLEFRLY